MCPCYVYYGNKIGENNWEKKSVFCLRIRLSLKDNVTLFRAKLAFLVALEGSCRFRYYLIFTKMLRRVKKILIFDLDYF